jgi:murein DD-endopeptidase MepM/ murein hydrolase activator NlpD
MITATALCIVARDWYHQRTENEQLSLQVRILAQKSAEIVELERAASDLMNDLNTNSTKVVTGTLSQARMKNITENWDAPEIQIDEHADTVAGFASKDPIEASSSAVNGLTRLQDHLTIFVATLKTTNNLLQNKRDVLAGVPSVKPADGWISSPYGKRRSPMTGRWVHHNGLDIAAERGTTVVAAAEGVIKHAGWKGAFGKLVEIDHGNGVVSRYAHNDRLFIRAGEKVLRGQKISTVGMTGRTTGPHLHYEIHINGRSVNPKRFLDIAPIQHFDSPVKQPAMVRTLARDEYLAEVDDDMEVAPMGGEETPLEANEFVGPINNSFVGPVAPNNLIPKTHSHELIVVNTPQLEAVAMRMAGSVLPFGVLVFLLFVLSRQGRMAAIGRFVMATVEVPFKVFDNLLEREQHQQTKEEPVNFWANEPVPIKMNPKKKNPYSKTG